MESDNFTRHYIIRLVSASEHVLGSPLGRHHLLLLHKQAHDLEALQNPYVLTSIGL